MRLMDLQVGSETDLNTPQLRIPGTFLIQHCILQARYHTEKADFYRKHASEMDEEHIAAFEMPNRHTGPVSPTQAAELKAKEHGERSVWFSLHAKFLEGGEMYDITSNAIHDFELGQANLG